MAMVMTTAPFSTLVNPTNTTSFCSEDIVKSSCFIHESTSAWSYTIALLRLISSSLSFIGASSIIFSAIRKRQVFSPKVHPIFVFSIADILLSMLWIAGSALWLLRSSNMRRGWCFAASLMTVIFECVVINLTLVYAIHSYSSVKKLMAAAEHDVYEDGPHVAGVGEYPCSVWHPLKSTAVYIVAWCLPVVLVMLPFAVVTTAGHYHILDHVYKCTCWCQPSFGNAVPFVGSSSNETWSYVYELRKVLTMYGAVLSAHYIVAFSLMMFVYYKLLQFIARVKKIQAETNQVQRTRLYKTIKLKLKLYQSQTKRRVALYIFVFILTGFFNFVLSFWIMIYEANLIRIERHNVKLGPIQRDPLSILVLYCVQSLTLPLQGFFNAIVYGWTQKGFVDAVGDKNAPDENVALFRNFPMDVDQSINNEDLQSQSPARVRRSISGSRTVTYRQSITMSETTAVQTGDITDYQETELSDSETEEERSMAATVSVHRV